MLIYMLLIQGEKGDLFFFFFFPIICEFIQVTFLKGSKNARQYRTESIQMFEETELIVGDHGGRLKYPIVNLNKEGINLFESTL